MPKNDDPTEMMLAEFRQRAEAGRPDAEATLPAHVTAEVNDAHVALDQLGAAKTKRVPRRNGQSSKDTQDVTLGLRERILSLRAPVSPSGAGTWHEIANPFGPTSGEVAWRPIETAPKDGTLFLVWAPGREPPMPIVEDFPHIDPTVRHIGVSKLRGLNADKLRETEDTFVIQENDQPLAVLLTYDKFLAIQEKLRSVVNIVDLLSSKVDTQLLLEGLGDVQANRVESLDSILDELKKGRG